MHLKEFVSNYQTYPVLFIGSGISLRYLKESFTWENLLKHICFEITENNEYFLDLKSQYQNENQTYSYDKIASELEIKFTEFCSKNRDGKFKEINDMFYKNLENNINVSRLKIYISKLFADLEIKDELQEEINGLKNLKKNISSIITTNYDTLIENIFDFYPLIGNDILMSNPYGTVYKIHGCVKQPQDIIVTEKDYEKFNKKYELIQAQLLSLFIHNPIIFIGYSISDENIKKLLRIIFDYVTPNSEIAEKIKSNFLIVEYEKDNTNLNISDYDIVLENNTTVRVNKLKTDNFKGLYTELANFQPHVSVMDIRKVYSIIREIEIVGSGIKVEIAQDIDNLGNHEKILVIGSDKQIQIQYENITGKKILRDYFNIIENKIVEKINKIDECRIQKDQYFPIYGFSSFKNTVIDKVDILKQQQKEKLQHILIEKKINKRKGFTNIQDIIDDDSIPKTYKKHYILYYLLKSKIAIDSVEKYLKQEINKDTEYRTILCGYDLVKYGTKEDIQEILKGIK